MKDWLETIGRANLEFAETLLEKYRKNPDTVADEWRVIFDQWDESLPTPKAASGDHPPRVMTSAPLKLDEESLAFLRRSPIFRSVSKEGLEKLAALAKTVTFEAGSYIARTGQTANDLYVIITGEVVITREGKEITRLGEGEVVGELAVFDYRPRSADIVAEHPCRMLQVEREQLDQLLQEDHQLVVGLLRVLAQRLRDAGVWQERVDRLVRSYRELGHLIAKVDPLDLRDRNSHPELTLEHYSFTEEDEEIKFAVKIGHETAGRSLGNIIEVLRQIYCGAIGSQFMHIDDLEIQEWIRVRLEEYGGNFKISRQQQLRILQKLTDAEMFENYLHRKFVGAKRFSLEGTESIIPLLDNAIEEAGNHGIDEVIIGMPHRGRLNVLVNIMDKPAAQVFREFEDRNPVKHRGGDVKYHLGYSADRITLAGHKVHLSLCFNPSHLEFVGPVVLGRARAKQQRFGDHERRHALPIILHGDAAFIGQGVAQELFNLSELDGYATGGAVHIVVNNQIGFTTDPQMGRSSQYATDVARMLQIPIFHVNGEHPNAVAEAIRLALDFRQAFRKDVVIDMYGYRKYGHNEGDDPTFTQPLLYQKIKRRKTVRPAYLENILKLGAISREEAERLAKDSQVRWDREFEASREAESLPPKAPKGRGLWEPYKGGADALVPEVATGVSRDKLVACLQAIAELPRGFNVHRKNLRFLNQQLAMAAGDQPLNWAAGEALAFASLLVQGTPIRLTGQDVQRGTFSHRHAVLHDQKTGECHVPLNHIKADQALLEVYNSPLSEIGVLGFEYGFSLDTPDSLVIWEAQFGDFCNVAQVIIDQFITSSEEKWSRLSGLCLFLPHGFEGQGPEHSSARLERFLMLAAKDNIQVVNLTTPAQLFHCLRRQVLRPLRKPLIVMSPKSLLRHPEAVSSIEELERGHFQRVIADEGGSNPAETDRILICSGKVYYELVAGRKEYGCEHTAILRLEQFYPLSQSELNSFLDFYRDGTPVIWVQEEPHNMGAWPFLKLRMGHRIGSRQQFPFECISRPEAASPATGSGGAHQLEQTELVRAALELG